MVLGHHAREEGHAAVQQIIDDFDSDRNGQIDFAEVSECTELTKAPGLMSTS